MQSRSTGGMNRRALFAAGLGGGALAVAQALGAPARALADNAAMLIGRVNTASKTTQLRVAKESALKCTSDSADGLSGEARGPYAAGVYGVSNNAKGVGVRARNTATKTSAELAGTVGVRARAPAGGIALYVDGRVGFSEGGRLVIPQGYTEGLKDLGPGVNTERISVLATLMTLTAGNWVTCAYVTVHPVTSNAVLVVTTQRPVDRDLVVAYLLYE